jgi:fructose-1,6-bisphosphatase/inositol monophosphatase family enzyme
VEFFMNSAFLKHQDELLAFGDTLIDDARKLILPLWSKSEVRSQLKEDLTPVSEVDLRCEELLREQIRRRFPDHGIIGEEFGSEGVGAEFVWTIDPIDGTQNLINRIPTFGTIVGLMYQGRALLGWIDHPVLGDSLRGGVQIGAFYNGTAVKLNDIVGPGLTPNDIVATNCPATFSHGDYLPVLDTVLRFHPHTRMYYDVFSHSLAIRGCVAVMVEYNLKVWDIAATQALVVGAGGVYRELGSDVEPGKPALYHAAFGKPGAVNLISEAIAAV